MKIFSNYYLLKVNIFSLKDFFINLKKTKIRIISLKKINPYQIVIKLNLLSYLRLKKLNYQYAIIEENGIFFIFKKLCNLIIVINILVLISSFILFNNLIFKIDINGKNLYINDEIRLIFDSNKIKKYYFLPHKAKLLSLKDIIINKYPIIEDVEIVLKGTVISLNYTLKEKEVLNDLNLGCYYAIKEGIIAYFDLEFGESDFKINDYVKVGDILIRDYLIKDDKYVYIGGRGKVYAYTWSKFIYQRYTKLNKVDEYFYLINLGRNILSSIFIDDEKIVKENVISYQYDLNHSNISIHYTILENIAKLQIN